jgi:hypothetical protein
MEYLDAKVTKIATCSICFKILESPLKLPCLNIVCQSHIQDILSTNGRIINCPICKSEHQMPCDGLQKCLKLTNSLDQIYGEDKTASVSKLEGLIEKLDLQDDQVTLAKNALECFIYDHLKGLQNQVDLEREELKLKIENDHDFFTKKIEDLMQILNDSAKKVEPHKYNRGDLAETFNKLSSDHRLNSINHDQIDEFNSRIENEMQALNSKLKEYEEIKVQTSFLHFDNNFLSKTSGNLLGSLEIKKEAIGKTLNLITMDNINLNIWDVEKG